MKVLVLTTPLTLNATSLTQKGMQTLAAVATAAVPLLRLPQQCNSAVHESVVPFIEAVHAVENVVAEVMLKGDFIVVVWRSLFRN
jgi:hypothetical protein